MALGAVSCDYLSEEPYHYLTPDAALVTEANYLRPVNEAYSFMWAGYNCVNGSFLDCATDDAMSTILTSNVHHIARGFISEDNTVYAPWTGAYRGIHQAIYAQNGLMDYATFLAGKTAAEVDALKLVYFHEMNALRAYYEFTLLQFYAGYPIVDKAYTLADEADLAGKKRDSYADCVEHIVALCDTAAKYLPVTRSDNEMGRMTKGAALALKAKTLAYAASPLYNQSTNTNPIIGYTAATVPADYPTVADRCKRAAKACLDVINLNTDGSISKAGTKAYALVACSSSAAFNTSLFTANAACKEFILIKGAAKNNSLENRHYPPTMSKNSGGGSVPTQELVNAFCKSNGEDIPEPQNGEPTVTTGRDKRFAATIAYDGTRYYKQIFTRTGTGATADAIGATADLSTTTGYYMYKFLYPMLNFTASNVATYFHLWPVIRLADMYLLYAEMAANGYGTFDTDPDGLGMTAKAAIQAVRKRAGFNETTDKYFASCSTTEDFIALVKRERRVEMAFEGQRYHDLRRWMDAMEVLNKPVHGCDIHYEGTDVTYTYFAADDRRAFTEKMYLHPIPKGVRKVNPAIEQNPGY